MEPTKMEPTETGPMKLKPTEAKATKTDRTKAEPTKAEPTKAEPTGYEKLALSMISDPDLAIFRRFSALNVQNLLYYQAELLHRWRYLRKTAAEDHESEYPVFRTFAESCQNLKYAKGVASHQWCQVVEIRKLLKDYNDCLIQQATLAKLERPPAYNLKMLRRLLDDSEHSTEYLIRLDEAPYEEKDDKDLITLPWPGRNVETDSLTRMMTGPLVDFYHKHIGHLFKKPYARDKEGIICVFHYSYRQLLRLANVLATIIATVLPITAAVVLYHIGRMDVRLGVVAAFTMAFSVIMATVTDARRVQIFVSTVAFAAVQIVFIATTSTAGPGKGWTT